jgi:CO/xanthine dehydrogenase Mo-binding subunit
MHQPINNDFLQKAIGTPVRRLDALDKASGRAKYIADMQFDGLLYARMIRSSRARARLLHVAVPDLPEGYYYISSKDIPEGGENRLFMITNDWRVFAEGTVRYIGETIGLLVGPDRNVLRDLEREIKISYEDLEPAFTIDEGLAVKGGPIHGEDNIFADYHLKKGDPDSIFSGSYRIIEDEILTGFQEHAYMEPQGMVGEYKNGKYVITASCQCPYYMRKAVAGILAVDQEDIVVIQSITGGAFGGKEHFPDVIAGPLVVAVHVIRKPVQIVFDRHEDISFTAKRHPSRTRFRTAVDADNRIVGMDIDIAINGGGYQSCSHIVLQRAMFSVNSVYDLPNIRIRGRAVATNTFPSDAFRGFGAPQGIFACEMHMSHLARALGMDDAEFKQQYFVQTGGTTVTNGKIHEEVKLPEMLEKVLKASRYTEKNRLYDREGAAKAVGISFYNHGGGFTGDGEKEIIKARVKVSRDKNHKVTIFVSNVEMGQGFQTTACKVAAKVLGIPLQDVFFQNPDTSVVPNSGPTVASRSMMIVGKLVERAARQLKNTWNDPGSVESVEEYVQPPGIEWNSTTFQGDAYPAFGWGICAVEVAVDPATAEVETKGIWTVHDIGVPIDDLIVHGQVHGGVIQALGYGSLEKLEVKNGAFLQNTFADYIIPTTMDFPAVESDLVENPYEYGPFGAKGMGELVFDGAAAAYAAAVQKAVNRNICSIPVNPELIMKLRQA